MQAKLDHPRARDDTRFWIPVGALTLAIAIVAGVWIGSPARIFDPTGFPARWSCGTWEPQLGWLHIASDVAIFGAYAAIPIVLVYFVRRRNDVPFSGLFFLFGAFIFACGFGHLIEALIFWHPLYRFAGVVKLFTAVVSWLTVAALVPIVPKALALPGLVAVNAELRREVEERRLVEAGLARSNAELERFHDVAVDREHRIIELKRVINRLHREAQRPEPYDLALLDADDARTS